MARIPLNRAMIIGKELEYVSRAAKSGHIAGDGLFSRKCHALLEKRLGSKKMLLTHTCTAGLEMVALLCRLKPGDEVILPSFTFVSVANTFYIQGAQLVFVDIRPDTLNIDENKIEEAITKRTKIIVPMHYAGIGCEMDKITKIAKKHRVYVVEDAAHAVDAKYKSKYLGTIGDFGVFSFDETKNVSCGEGGALSINNAAFLERAEVLWRKGTDRSQFLQGKVDRYSWIDVGASYLPSDISAAFLCAQLEKMDTITKSRRKIFDKYMRALTPLADDGVLQLPQIPQHCSYNGSIFYIILKDGQLRDSLIEHLNSRGIAAAFHYVPLHLSPMGRLLGYREGLLPVTERISRRLLRLPIYCGLKGEHQLKVIASIYDFFN